MMRQCHARCPQKRTLRSLQGIKFNDDLLQTPLDFSTRVYTCVSDEKDEATPHQQDCPQFSPRRGGDDTEGSVMSL